MLCRNVTSHAELIVGKAPEAAISPGRTPCAGGTRQAPPAQGSWMWPWVQDAPGPLGAHRRFIELGVREMVLQPSPFPHFRQSCFTGGPNGEKLKQERKIS